MAWLKLIVVALAAFGAAAGKVSAATIEGIAGETVRPVLAPAQVSGCTVAKPGSYTVQADVLIELNYVYPIVPTAMPKKVEFMMPSGTGAVGPSPLGIRTVATPGSVGTSMLAFYFEARCEGTQSVTLCIDDERYEYTFTVTAPANPSSGLEIRQQTAYQVDPIKLRVVGHESFQVHRLELIASVPSYAEAGGAREREASDQADQKLPANGRLTFYGKCLDADGLSHWGDCAKYDDSFTMDVQVAARYETDPSGLNRLGYVIRAITPSGLGSVDADEKVLFLNGPPRNGTESAARRCPFRLVINTKDQNEVVQAISLEPLFTKMTTAEQTPEPAAEIPEPDHERPYFPIVYFFGNSSCDLSSGDLRWFLADFPKAILFRLRADEISSDDDFYYLREYRFDMEWAFAKAPEDNFFKPRGVWTRDTGGTWRRYSEDATVAFPR